MTDSEVLKAVRGFAQHGAIFKSVMGGQARGSCPLCGSSKRTPFCVEPKKLLWSCKSCGEGGDLPKFLAHVMKISRKRFVGPVALKLASDRGLKVRSLQAWGIGTSISGNRFNIPALRGAHNLINVQVYEPTAPKDRRVCSTTGGHAGLIRETKDTLEAAEIVWICEGAWDAIALWEGLRAVGRKDAVVGILGAGALTNVDLQNELSDKDVLLCFDNDLAGSKADSKARELLDNFATSIRSVHWNPNEPKGFDVRDLYLRCRKKPNRFLKEIERLLRDRPRIVVPATKATAASAGHAAAGPRSRVKRPTGRGIPSALVRKIFQKWLYMPDPEVLNVVFGTVFANRLDGDPLWLFLVGQSGIGKSALLQNFRGGPLITTASTLTRAGLVSGSNLLGAADPSLLPKLNEKVLVVKDFTAILSTPQIQRDEIFGILRDAFDGHCERHFGTLVRRYHSRFGIVAGTTPAIEKFGPSHAVLGERFLKYYMRLPGRISVGEQLIRRVLDNTGREKQMAHELAEITHKALDLRVVANQAPKVGKLVRERILGLAQWTAAMRGAVARDKYRQTLEHRPTSEIGSRLARQLIKLAQGMAIYKHKRNVGLRECKILARIARDSAPDMVEEVVRQLYVRHPNTWVTCADLVEWTKFPQPDVERILNDLVLLHVVGRKRSKGRLGRATWRLTRELIKLMQPLALYADERRWQRSR